jgi:hypothetical protein
MRAVIAIVVGGVPATGYAQAPMHPHEAAATIEALGGRIYRSQDGEVDIIDLKGEKVADAHLALLHSLSTVRILNLDGSQVTERGLEQLLVLPNLEEVSLRRTQVSPAAAAALKVRHPKLYRVEVDAPGLRIGRLAALVVFMPMGLFGVWLMWMSQKKRPVLAPQLYARGMVLGVLLIVVSVVLVAVAIVQAAGIDFHLADLFG